jgi:hypothetical protein
MTRGKNSSKTRPYFPRRPDLVPASAGGDLAFDGPFRVSRDAGTVSIEIDWDRVQPASQSFSADLARARLRHGQPELHFVQTHPTDETRIARYLVVRYAREVFVQRREANEEFRVQLEEYLEQRRQDPLLEIQAFDALSGEDAAAPTVKLDVDFELIVRSVDRASMVFVATDAWNRHAIIRGTTSLPNLKPIVEITLPTTVLAGLLRSWCEVAAALAPGAEP